MIRTKMFNNYTEAYRDCVGDVEYGTVYAEKALEKFLDQNNICREQIISISMSHKKMNGNVHVPEELYNTPEILLVWEEK